MTRVRTDIQVDLGALWVDETALGKSLEVKREGYRVVIRIPPAPATDQVGTPTFDGSKEAPEGAPAKRGLRRLTFSVYWDGPDLGADPGNLYAVGHFVMKAREVVKKLARDLVDWTRVAKHQEWLSDHAQDLPFTDAGGAWNDETNELLPIVVGLMPQMSERPAGSEIDATFIAELPGWLQQEPPIPALLLADALFFVRRTGPVELQRAVLLAAIATELKVKEILRSAPPKKAALVEIIIGRDAPVAVAALFDKTLSAAIGHSLLDEQKDLFKRVWRLFELRNQIAHSGAVPDLESARDLVRAAREASEWLDSIKPGNTASQLLDQSKSGDPS
ncbi:MAG TPA: hypothetical protein DCK98_02000 [Chloroflexi bacterium]|jgi:hypothetical protein|nr:hypothetical protein [Chloroflexota bacterium]HAL25854.1 hypothetical protein [Chloroflexota bacterium]